MFNCYVIAVLLIQIAVTTGRPRNGPEVSREPTEKEIAACRVTLDDFLKMAPTWPEQFDFIQKTVRSLYFQKKSSLFLMQYDIN